MVIYSYLQIVLLGYYDRGCNKQAKKEEVWGGISAKGDQRLTSGFQSKSTQTGKSLHTDREMGDLGTLTALWGEWGAIRERVPAKVPRTPKTGPRFQSTHDDM